MHKYSTNNDRTQKGCHLRPVKDVSLAITWVQIWEPQHTRKIPLGLTRVFHAHVSWRSEAEADQQTSQDDAFGKVQRRVKKSRDCAIKGATSQGLGN